MCVYHFVVFVYNMGASFINFMFFWPPANCISVVGPIVEYYILIFWQNKVMMMMWLKMTRPRRKFDITRVTTQNSAIQCSRYVSVKFHLHTSILHEAMSN